MVSLAPKVRTLQLVARPVPLFVVVQISSASWDVGTGQGPVCIGEPTSKEEYLLYRRWVIEYAPGVH